MMSQKNKDFFAQLGNMRGPNPVPPVIKVQGFTKADGTFVPASKPAKKD